MWLYFVDRKDLPIFINNTVYPTAARAIASGQQVGRALDPEGVATTPTPADTESKHKTTFIVFESHRVVVYIMRLCPLV